MTRKIVTLAFGGKRYRFQTEFNNHTTSVLRFGVFPEKDVKQALSKARAFFEKLHTLRLKGGVLPLFGFEIVGNDKDIWFYVVVDNELVEAVQTLIVEYFGVHRLEQWEYSWFLDQEKKGVLPTIVLEGKLKNNFIFSLKTEFGDTGFDPLFSFLEVLDSLEKGQEVRLAFVVRPFVEVWKRYAMEAQKALIRGDQLPDFLSYIYSGGPLFRFVSYLRGLLGKKGMEEAVKEVEDPFILGLVENVEGKKRWAGYQTGVWVKVRSADADQVEGLVRKVRRALRQFDNPPFNKLEFKQVESGAPTLRRQLPVAFFQILSSAELAGFWHQPVEVGGVWLAKRRAKPLPPTPPTPIFPLKPTAKLKSLGITSKLLNTPQFLLASSSQVIAPQIKAQLPLLESFSLIPTPPKQIGSMASSLRNHVQKQYIYKVLKELVLPVFSANYLPFALSYIRLKPYIVAIKPQDKHNSTIAIGSPQYYLPLFTNFSLLQFIKGENVIILDPVGDLANKVNLQLRTERRLLKLVDFSKKQTLNNFVISAARKVKPVEGLTIYKIPVSVLGESSFSVVVGQLLNGLREYAGMHPSKKYNIYIPNLDAFNQDQLRDLFTTLQKTRNFYWNIAAYKKHALQTLIDTQILLQAQNLFVFNTQALQEAHYTNGSLNELLSSLLQGAVSPPDLVSLEPYQFYAQITVDGAPTNPFCGFVLHPLQIDPSFK